MKIYFFKSKDPFEMLKEVDINRLDEYGAWLNTLPPLENKDPAFRVTSDLAVEFDRRIDATAFRLKFGL
jgi:hypothetical protein